jgi:alkylhydroperoxidase family enzyme
MALINTVSPEQAEGTIKEAYDMFMENLGVIPRPLEMMSASPAIFGHQLQKIHYYTAHPTLSFALLSHIRYLVAHNLNYSFCMDFNKHILKKQGLEDDDIHQIEADPTKSLLEEKESAMLAFVVKAAKAPGSVEADEIKRLKEMGWEDRDLVEALAHGVNMIDHSIMMEVFQMDQDCMVG